MFPFGFEWILFFFFVCLFSIDIHFSMVLSRPNKWKKKKKQHENQFDNCAESLNLAQETDENSVLLTYLMNEINKFQVNKKPYAMPVEMIAHASNLSKKICMLYHVTRNRQNVFSVI